MKIEHIGLWTIDLERMREFYETYFSAKSGALYHNPKKGFHSYFLTFDSGSRLELMHREDINKPNIESYGYAHLAVGVGDKEDVDNLVDKLKEDGYALINGPRKTGDGYYEAVIKDPEGNLIELTTD
ncbi:VOC family protein [Alkalibacterium sp. 20]|uniref:VOC family protein n=1 Tax=Alkalibacterium sp. 20 TaxID=1798803 RepID=UPI0009001E31|nr:VOC family protein [Alkalibacterium sp. 20]OJF94585.1 glyoxalase [Alkalibacterium sp. 20]